MVKKTLIILLTICSLAFAQKVVIYMNDDDTVHKRMGKALIKVMESYNYSAKDHTNDIEDILPNGIKNYEQIKYLGKQFEAQFFCIVKISRQSGRYNLNVRFVDVETRAEAQTDTTVNNLNDDNEMRRVAQNIVQKFIQSPEPTLSHKDICIAEGYIWEDDSCWEIIVTNPTPRDICISEGKIWRYNSCYTEEPYEPDDNIYTSQVQLKDDKFVNSLGIRTGLSFRFTSDPDPTFTIYPEVYLRRKLDDIRLYMGLGWWSGIGSVLVNDVDMGVKYKGNEFQLVGFIEWHTYTDDNYYVYGGPGVVLGYYDYNYYYSYGTWTKKISGTGVDIGGQGGIGGRVGAFVWDIDVRPMFTMRFWNLAGFMCTVGVNLGFAF